MASIFKPLRTIRMPDGKRITKSYRTWYVRYRDGEGRERKRKGYRDKAATLQRAAEIERDVERQQSGLSDRFTEHRKRPLAEHLADWHQALLDRGNTKKHADLVKRRAEALIQGCKFRVWGDLSASSVQAWLAELRRSRGTSMRTANFYLQSAKQFCGWCVRDGRVPDNPLAHLEGGNPKIDKRHERRAFTADELQHLLRCTENATEVFRLTGTERATLYRTATETGLRARELRSLTVGSFDLDGDPPTVTVNAAYSKRRREDVLPIRPEFAAALRTFLSDKLPTTTAFRMPSAGNLSRMLHRDREAARAAWIGSASTDDDRSRREGSSFLEYRDAAGRVLDFHALRHTFITNLARGGVHPKLAQQLARHSTITLTMDRYSHTVIGELSEALTALPMFDNEENEATPKRATGTFGSAAEKAEGRKSAKPSNPARKAESNGAQCGRKIGRTTSVPSVPGTRVVSPIGTRSSENEIPQVRAAAVQTARNQGDSGADRHRLACVDKRTGEGGIRTPGTGFIPYDGLANRCFKPLSHLSRAAEPTIRLQRRTKLPRINSIARDSLAAVSPTCPELLPSGETEPRPSM